MLFVGETCASQNDVSTWGRVVLQRKLPCHNSDAVTGQGGCGLVDHALLGVQGAFRASPVERTAVSTATTETPTATTVTTILMIQWTML